MKQHVRLFLSLAIFLLLTLSGAWPLYAGQALIKRAVSRSVPKIATPIIPFPTNPVWNADSTVPGSAMLPAGAQLQLVRGYVPSSMANASNFAKRYQMATQLLAKGDYERERSDHLNKIVKGNPSVKKIALTFDDGPHAKFTLQLLSELKSLHVPATFFVVGKQAVKFPTLVQLEVLEGNEVGNHTYDHVDLTKIPASQVPYELGECDAVLRHIIGTSPRFFRPPGGDVNAAVIRAAAAHGYITTLWTDDPGDFKRISGSLILKRLNAHLRPGAIILLHDGIPQTMQMLPAFVAESRRHGYQFVTMGELAAERGVHR